MAGSSFSLPEWASLYAVPVACVASTYLLYTRRGALVNRLLDWVARTNPKKTGKEYLVGNFGPVSREVHSENLAVEGQLPAELDGLYVRTGPNPYFTPIAGYHWFDGDGMLHATRIKGGKASYGNRYVSTSRLQQEKAANKPLFVKMGDAVGVRGVVVMMLDKLRAAWGGLQKDDGNGTGNTALQFHAGRLLALHEGDLPYAIRILCSGLVETMGRIQVHPDWKGPFTAHPKQDPKTGEMVFFGYQFREQPSVHVGIMDKSGATIKRWGVNLPYPVMMHDCAITQNYFVLLHLPLVFDPKAMVKQGTLPFVFRKDLSSRIGLLRRDAPSADLAEVQWFELPGPGFMVFHVANAFEDEQGNVRVYGCQLDNMTLDLDEMDHTHELARLNEYVLSPATGKAEAPRKLSPVWGDFPVVHPGSIGYPCRYTYVATMDPASRVPSFTGIGKFDLKAPAGQDACTQIINYPRGCFGGEAVFVPRTEDPLQSKGEDDGFLVVYVYHTAEDCTRMHVYCARTMDQQPLATVRLPQRVPYGFHGTWVTGAQIASQTTSL